MGFDNLPDAGDLAALQVGQGLYNGLVFGEHTDWPVLGVENLLAYESRISDTPLPQRDGDLVNGRWAAGRIAILPFTILGSDHAEARASWLAAFNALDPWAEDWLAFHDHGGRYLVRCRVARRRIEQNPGGARSGSAAAVVELKLADPRIYDANEGLQTAFPPFGAAVGGGFEWPVVDFPIDMAAGSGGTGLVFNSGQATAYPLIRLFNDAGAGSSITAFSLTNVTTGVALEVNTTILAGQALVVDMDALVRAAPGPHVYIDTSSRYGDWQHPRTLFGLRPGFNELEAGATGGTPTLRLDWLQPTI